MFQTVPNHKKGINVKNDSTYKPDAPPCDSGTVLDGDAVRVDVKSSGNEGATDVAQARHKGGKQAVSDDLGRRFLPETAPDVAQARQFDTLYPVPFYEDLLVIASHNGQPYVVMRPVVDGIGLNWASQYSKMVDKFKATVAMIATVGEDGRQREMIALPLRKFPGWLYSLSPSKVAPELRAKIVRYQDECDEVLWRYWTEGVAIKPGLDLIPAKDAMTGCDRIISFMARKDVPRAAKVAKLPLLEKYARSAGIPMPDVSDLIGPDQPRLEGV